MSIRIDACRGREKRPSVRRWEATRRVAYDADADEYEAMRVTHPDNRFSKPPQLTPFIKQTEALTRRLKEDRLQAKSSTLKSSKPEISNHQPRQPQICTASGSPEVEIDADKSLSNGRVELSRDEWIIEEFDYSSRWNHGYHGRWVNLAERSWQFNDSRVQPKGSLGYIPPPVHKPKVTFMSLPPEIRNTVYEHAVPERSILITCTHPKKEARSSRRCWSDEHIVPQPVRSRLTHEPEWGFTSEDFVDAINLLLTCKEINAEVETFLYSRIQFCFHSLKSLRRFFRMASKSGIQAMRKLFISQDGYGNSQMTVDQKYRERYYKSWEDVCFLVGHMTPNLKHLKLKVYDRDWPSELSGKDYDAVWKSSILKTAPVLVPKVDVRIHHRMIDQNEEVLKDLAREVEDSMMTKEGRDDRDRRETEWVMAELNARKAAKDERERKKRAKLNAPPPPTELVISMDDIQKQANKATTAKRFRSKGLDGYDKIDPGI